MTSRNEFQSPAAFKKTSTTTTTTTETDRIKNRPPHPAVFAFLTALDTDLNPSSSPTSDDNDTSSFSPSSVLTSPPSHRISSGTKKTTTTATPPFTPAPRTLSPFLLKTARSLTWRSRHIGTESFEMTLRRGMLPRNPITFHVRQEHGEEVVENDTKTQKNLIVGTPDSALGTGATVWPASVVLMKYLERHNHCLDRSVVDLGCGTGITSIAAAVLGAKLVVCTDGMEAVVSLARENVLSASNNDLMEMNTDLVEKKCSTDEKKEMIRIGKCDIYVQKFIWGDASDEASVLRCLQTQKQQQQPSLSIDNDHHHSHSSHPHTQWFDIVLVSDCVLPKLFPMEPLVLSLSTLIGPQTVAYLSYEKRFYPNYDPAQKFKDLAQAHGLTVTIISSDDMDPMACVDDIELWEVRQKKEFLSCVVSEKDTT